MTEVPLALKPGGPFPYARVRYRKNGQGLIGVCFSVLRPVIFGCQEPFFRSFLPTRIMLESIDVAEREPPIALPVVFDQKENPPEKSQGDFT